MHVVGMKSRDVARAHPMSYIGIRSGLVSEWDNHTLNSEI